MTVEGLTNMRATIRLVDKLSRFCLKAVLVAVPAVVSSYCSFRVADRNAETGFRAVVVVVGNLTEAVERQGRVIEQMKGEVAVLKMLATARVGAGVIPFAETYSEQDAGSPLPWDMEMALKAQQPKKPLRIVP
jgi:hypothetical protein